MFEYFVWPRTSYEVLGPFLTLAVAQFVAAGFLSAEIIRVDLGDDDD